MRRKIRYEAADGDKRTIVRFLWWPREIDGEWRWLERASIAQRFWAVGWRGYWVARSWGELDTKGASAEVKEKADASQAAQEVETP